MGEKIVIGPINKGIRTDRTPFVIDNDSFPTLINAYQWRGRAKRKRGTSLLGRLQRFFNSSSKSYNPGSSTITLDGTGSGNLLTGFTNLLAISPNAGLTLGTISIVDSTGPQTYTDPNKDGTLQGSLGGTGTINYATGMFTITGGAGHTVTATFNYYPDLPVMGLEELNLPGNEFPGTLGFDTVYSYNILMTSPYSIYDVSFYKNPPTTPPYNYSGYVQKTTVTPTSWNGQNYQQFWTINYQGALWATNGINVPFVVTNIGMQYAPSATITYNSNTGTTLSLTITNCPLTVGDFVFVNEWTGANASTLNFQSGYVTACAPNTPPLASKTLTITFPNATIGAGPYTPGIVQYLTNQSDTTKDCIRWYDGDPTDANPPSPALTGNFGWVNFCPPLLSGPAGTFSISDLPPAQYYLIGCRMILPYKDRLLFIGPVVQTSTAGSQVYLPDTIIFSQNGTPYYTASFTGSVTSTTTLFNPILTPINQTATANSYFEDVTGYGGWYSTGFNQPILSASSNEDVIILGYTNKQVRLVYTGDGFVPFNSFVINSEFGTSSTFTTITMDRGVLSRGNQGFITTSQISAERIDLDLPDQVFEINLTNNGPERMCAQRDFINEWVYFTYSSNEFSYVFPTQTMQYNYRDNSWGIFNECYTTYGTFRPLTGNTWATIGMFYPTWADWNVPWNAGASTLLQPKVIGGNQQGFILFRDEGTGEGNSLEIQNISFASTITGVTQANPAVITSVNSFQVGQRVTISGVVGMTQLNGNTYTITAVTPTTITIGVNSTGFGVYVSGGIATPSNTIYSPNHCLNQGDYITISGVLGTVGTLVNGMIFSVDLLNTPATNEFSLNPPLTGTGTYLGGGVVQRMYVPLIQTKQFQPSWGFARKTRLGPQQYLLTATANAQIELQIYLSQNPIGLGDFSYNSGNIVPGMNVVNNSLLYSDTIYTCTESTNLGLTAANINLQMVTSQFFGDQEQIWHRLNTSLIGDTVQLGFTLSDTQMRTVDSNGNPISQFAEIELHGIILDVQPSQLLA